MLIILGMSSTHDDVIKWKYFAHYWPFVHWLVTGEFPSQRPVTGTLMFLLICAWINGWVNNGKAGDLRRHRAHYDITVMVIQQCSHRSNVPRTTFWSVQNFMQMQNQFTSHCLWVSISLSILMECIICNTNLNITVIRYILVMPLYIHDRLQALSKLVRF